MSLTNTRGYYPAEEITLVHSGSDYFERVCELTKAAKSEIHFHNYIFHPDETGRFVADAFIEAAHRGVKIYILLDSFGSARLRNSEMLKEMKDAGISVRFFSPYYITSGFRVGRRMHQKVFVVDGAYGIVSGINVSNDYRGTESEMAWLDYGVFIRGEVCRILVNICLQLENNRFTSNRVKLELGAANGKPLVRFRQSDYLRNKRQISRAYTVALQEARKEILIINAYFLPGTRLRALLAAARKRGVKITIVLSAKSDVPIVKRAMNWYYDWLIRNNIHLSEYDDTNVHAKAALFDGELTIIGSYNLNNLSEYMSVELNADIRDAKFAAAFKSELEQVMAKSIPVDAAALKKRVWSNRLLNYASYRLLSWSMRMMYLATRKDRVNQLE
ncbi:MAG TPA: phospholipase D-like domain-containing protein [Chitinophagales bacterium]|nr:phospholipase D-like domain-containing protein [Chitinophagales bacterium]